MSDLNIQARVDDLVQDIRGGISADPYIGRPDCERADRALDTLRALIDAAPATPPTDDLGAAWGEAEAALTEGWSALLFRTMSDSTLGYGIELHLPSEDHDRLTPRIEFVHAISFAAALRALAARLSAAETTEEKT